MQIRNAKKSVGNAGHTLSYNCRLARKLRNEQEKLARNVARCFKVIQVESHYDSPCDHLFERNIFKVNVLF